MINSRSDVGGKFCSKQSGFYVLMSSVARLGKVTHCGLNGCSSVLDDGSDFSLRTAMELIQPHFEGYVPSLVAQRPKLEA
jgi:hypothetical protein